MTLTLLNLTALALAAVSGAYDASSKPFLLRGSTGESRVSSSSEEMPPPPATSELDRENFLELGFSCKKHKKRGEMECGSCGTRTQQGNRYERFCNECCNGGDDNVGDDNFGNDDNTKNGGDDCDEGLSMGERSMRNKWEREGDDCDNAWNVDSMADGVKRNYPNSGSWRTKTRNNCARRGVDNEVKKIKKECFEDNPDQCLGLGQAAADQIALSDVCDMYSSNHHSNYERSCREMAYTICEGQIAGSVDKYCPDKMPSTSGLRKLGRECPSKVDSLIGRSDIEAVAA